MSCINRPLENSLHVTHPSRSSTTRIYRTCRDKVSVNRQGLRSDHQPPKDLPQLSCRHNSTTTLLCLARTNCLIGTIPPSSWRAHDYRCLRVKTSTTSIRQEPSPSSSPKSKLPQRRKRASPQLPSSRLQPCAASESRTQLNDSTKDLPRSARAARRATSSRCLLSSSI